MTEEECEELARMVGELGAIVQALARFDAVMVLIGGDRCVICGAEGSVGSQKARHEPGCLHRRAVDWVTRKNGVER